MTNTMNFRELLRRLMNHQGRSSLLGRHPRARRCAILVEALETRTLMSGSPPVVTTFSDTTLHDHTLSIGAEFSANYSDPESDPLASVTILSLPSDGTLVLNGTDITAGQIIVAADLPNLDYVPTPATIGSDSFSWTASDGTSNATVSALANIDITDAAPTLTDAAQSVNHDTALPFIAGDFTTSFNDTDGDTLQSVTIDTLPANGLLTLTNGTASSDVGAGQVIAAADLPNLRYTPNAGFSGTDAFRWNASDGILTAQSDANFNLNIIETAPTLAGVTISVHPGASFTFTAGTFSPGFHDAENDTLHSLTLATLPSHGTLTLSNLPVSVNQTITAGQLANLRYQPAKGYGGNDVFLWNASDGLLAASASATLRIIQGEHAPTDTGFSLLVPQNGSVTLSATSFASGFADQDVSDSFQSVALAGLPTHGVLGINNGGTITPVTASQSIPVAQLSNLVYTPTAGFHGADSFKWRASDGTLLSSTLATTLNVNAFQLTGNSVIILQGDTTPSTSDFTDFRVNSVNAPAAVTRTYTITNVGAASLTLTGNAPVTMSGVNAGDFTVSQPASTTLAAGGNTTFTITFHPQGAGVRNAIISIANSLGGNAPFTFAVRGKGVITTHLNVTNAQLSAPAGMDFVTTTNGSGVGAANGQIIHMTYTGYLLTGSVFDATANHGNIPFMVRLDNNFTDDNLYAASGSANTIQKFPLGLGTAFVSSSLNDPQGMAFDGLGNLYVANSGNNTIEKFTSSGHATVFASTGLNHPTGLAFDAGGNLYVANSGNNTIEKFTASGNATLFASTGLNNPQGLAVDFAGNVFAANSGNNTIEKFTQSTGTNGALTVTPSVFAASDTTGSLNAPVGIAFDSSGNLFAANSGANNIEKLVQTTQTNGSLTVTASVFSSTGLSNPQGLAFDASGNLFAANAGSNTIEQFTINPNDLSVSAATFATTSAAPSGLAFNSNQPYINRNVSNRLADTPVIQGWEAGLQGIKVGESRILIIPSTLGYGATGSPPNIPGGATLIFEVTCNAIDPTPSLGVAFTATQSAILPGDVTPNTSDGTDFGTLAVGQSSAVNTFYLFDNGQDGFTGDLMKFVSISGAGFTGSNAADFAITGHSGIGFDITFTPHGAGKRTAIAHIITNNPVRPDFTFTVTGSAASVSDLALAFGNVTFPAGGIVSGGSTKLTLPLIIGNLGNAAVPSTTPTTDLQIYAHNNATNADTLLLNIPAQQVAGLGAGARKNLNLSVSFPSSIVSGNYSFKAVINASQTIVEASASNDTVSTATSSHLTIAQGFYNLTGNLVSDTIPANNVSGPAALKGNVTLSVKNAGNLVLPAGQKVTILLVAHSATAGNTTLAAAVPFSVAGLKPGLSANVTVPVNYLAGLSADTYQIEAVISTSPLLPEVNFGDNTITTTAANGTLSFTTTDPDISATLGNSTIPTNINSSGNTTYSGNLQVRVTNAGAITLPSGEQVTVQVIAHSAVSGDVILVGTSGKFSVGSLLAGRSSTFSIPVKFLGSALTAGNYTLEARVTPVQPLTEASTSNNLATQNASGNSLTLTVA